MTNGGQIWIPYYRPLNTGPSHTDQRWSFRHAVFFATKLHSLIHSRNTHFNYNSEGENPSYELFLVDGHAATATRSRKAGSAFHKLRQVAHTVTQHCAPWGYPMTLIVVDTYYRSIRHQGSPEFANTGLWSKHQMWVNYVAHCKKYVEDCKKDVAEYKPAGRLRNSQGRV